MKWDLNKKGFITNVAQEMVCLHIIGMIYLPYIEDDKVRTDAIKLYLELSVEDIIKIKERFEKVGLYPIDKN